MSDSRERFEAWAKAPPREFDTMIQTEEGPWPGQYDDYICQCAWEGWQAAEAETARRCLAILESVTPLNPMTANDCIDAIKAEFPEAFK